MISAVVTVQSESDVKMVSASVSTGEDGIEGKDRLKLSLSRILCQERH